MARVGVAVCVLLWLSSAVPGSADNYRPIIGILSQEPDEEIEAYYPHYTGYIAASYVKYLESSGSRVVPVWINQTTEYYEYIVSSVNGLLFPGGDADFNVTDGYAAAGSELYNLAKKKNDAGVYFPVWGTCLGFELLFAVSGNHTDRRKDCDVIDVSLPIKFVPGYCGHKLYKDAPENILSALKNENVTFNNHFWCITEEKLRKMGIVDDWHILSMSSYKEFDFISSIEHKVYPFYGVQFHPEKSAFEWKTETITHSAIAIVVGQYFANFFVNEARKNNNSYPSSEENSALIYNYPVEYTGEKISFEQTYLFEIKREVVPTTTTTAATTTTASTTTTDTTTTTTITTTTTATTTTTETTTMQSSTTDESTAASVGIIHAQSITKPSAASTQTSVPHFALCISAFLVWLVKQ